jgi:V/A-type H+-transporting ATPase subunit D
MELGDERHLAEEGHELLDEKRILLAAAIRRELARLRSLREDCRRLEADARRALQAALKQDGLDELSVYPPLSTHNDRLISSRSRLLGLELINVQWQAGTAGARERPVVPSPEATACADAYRTCIGVFAELAACSVNLRRLAREFVRTERRARAIENILLPEITSSIRTVEEALELLDQEEIARVRWRRSGPA